MRDMSPWGFPPPDRSFGSGLARGVMVGGALWILALTVGTPWQPDLEGKVLFSEEIGEQPWRMVAVDKLADDNWRGWDAPPRPRGSTTR
jgi:muramoyltetrapeptide carboxypeptidase LdcA involved in peptidoglycan recycling